MNFLGSLNRFTIAALVCFCLSKFFSLGAIIGLFTLAHTMPAAVIAFGSLWGGFLLASIILCFFAHHRTTDKYERETYERLKEKYGK